MTNTAHHQNGRAVTFPEATTEDLIISAIRCKEATHRDLARAELTRRGIDWSAYLGCR